MRGHRQAGRDSRSLKRPCRIDQKIRAVLGEHPADIAVAVRHDNFASCKAGAELCRFLRAAAGNQHLIAGASETPRQARAKPAITAKDENAAQRMRSIWSGRGTQHVSRRPNQR
jgi:hypothetical protein